MGALETVEVQKRYRSLTARDEVAVVIVVREKPRRWVADWLMFAPILGYEEGYGFAYGMQFNVVDVPWRGGQFSVPMTWGGDRRTALEMEGSFGNGWQGRLRGGASARRRMHPHFEIEDERLRLWAGLDGRLASGLRVDVEVGREEVVFGDSSDWLTRAMVGLEYGSAWSEFPRDDVKLRAGVGTAVGRRTGGRRVPAARRCAGVQRHRRTGCAGCAGSVQWGFGGVAAVRAVAAGWRWHTAGLEGGRAGRRSYAGDVG